MGEESNPFTIIEISPDEKWYVTFEDDGSVAYMYLGKMERSTLGEIQDDLWVYNMIDLPIHESKEVFLYWSEDSTKAALIVDQECWGIFDLKNWRKLNAPRVGNRIESISKETWDYGLINQDGVPIKDRNIN